jgi:Bacterial extracellular solute-binding protein
VDRPGPIRSILRITAAPSGVPPEEAPISTLPRIAIACLAAALLPLAARADLPPDPDERQRRRPAASLRLGHTWTEEEARVLQILATRFAQAEGLGEPQLVPFARSVAGRAQLTRALEEGAVDLVIADQLELAPWLSRGLLAPVDAEAQQLARELSPWARAPFEQGGHSWGLPLAADTLAVFYNTKLLHRAPQHTGELPKLIARTSPGQAVVAVEPELRMVAPFIEAFGGKAFDGGKAQLDTPQAAQALSFLRELSIAQKLPLLPHDELVRRFNQGKLAMVIGGATLWREVYLIDAAASALPVVDPAMVAAKGRQEQARRLLLLLAGREGAVLRARGARQVVPSEAVLDDPWLGSDQWTSTLRHAAAQAMAASSAGGFPQAEEDARAVLAERLATGFGSQLTTASAPQPAAPPPKLLALLVLCLLAAAGLRRLALRH